MVSFANHTEYAVPVRGGDLAVLRWPPVPTGAETILLVHGITANALAWSGVVEAVDGQVDVIAPDLRGRAGSRDITGPWGIDYDVDDLIAVLDHAGLDRVTVVGHSLGGFVACTLARRHPDRVTRVIAVDGGLGFPLPAGSDGDAILAAVLGPAIAKLEMTFDDLDAYVRFHHDHPAFAGNRSVGFREFLRRDAIASDGRIVSSCVADAVRADGCQVLFDESVGTAIAYLDCPTTLMYAARGLFDEEQALYNETRLALVALDPDRVRLRLVPDTNHYTIVVPGPGADAIADEIAG
jgi:pimeloyl-ACP methyl ester carboxylesterase